VYKAAFDHGNTVRIILQGDGRTMPEHFHPGLLQAFTSVASDFEGIFASQRD
jgi:putative two-component system response regulator